MGDISACDTALRLVNSSKFSVASVDRMSQFQNYSIPDQRIALQKWC